MITFEIMSGVRVYGLSRELKDKIYNDLSFENKAYTDAKKYGRYISSDIEPMHHFFSVNKEEGYVFIPRGYFYTLHMHIHKLGLEHKLIDRTLVLPKLNFKFKGKPRDYQLLAIKDLMKYPNGILQAATGSGKTFVGINMIAKRQQPTLILVHSKELMNQWEKSIIDLLGEIPGIVGGGRCDVRPITIGIINSVKNKIDILWDKFGHIILDECHRVAGVTWIDTLEKLSAKYYLGLSATIFRNDELTGTLNAFIGPTMHKVDKEHLFNTGAVLKPEIIRIQTNFDMPPGSEYISVISNMVRDKRRNELIVDAVIRDLNKNNTPVLIVSDRVQHCEILSKMLKNKGAKVSLLLSKMNKQDRLDSVGDIKDNSTEVLIATGQLIGEGFDAPNLHALFLTTPVKYAGKLIQVTGRIQTRKRQDCKAV